MYLLLHIETVILLCDTLFVPGLSKLQRFILLKALVKFCASFESQGALDEHLYYSEVKIGFFGLSRDYGDEGDASGWVFAKSTIRKYNRYSASIARAAKRLRERGLILIEGHRIGLTDRGAVIAAAMDYTDPGAFGFVPIPEEMLFWIIDMNGKAIAEAVGWWMRRKVTLGDRKVTLGELVTTLADI
jgi:hypothetical protein